MSKTTANSVANAADWEKFDTASGNYPNTPLSVFKVLSRDNNALVRAVLAKNIHAPSSILNRLALDKSHDVLITLARNVSLPKLGFKRLVGLSVGFMGNPFKKWHVSNRVKELVAKNPSVPLKVLKFVLSEKDIFVLRAAAGNPATPIEILERFSRNQDSIIRLRVSGNPSTPSSLLESLSYDKDDNVREKVAGNPNSPVEVLERLSRDEILQVRIASVNNASIPLEVLERLSINSDHNVEFQINTNPRFIEHQRKFILDTINLGRDVLPAHMLDEIWFN